VTADKWPVCARVSQILFDVGTLPGGVSVQSRRPMVTGPLCPAQIYIYIYIFVYIYIFRATRQKYVGLLGGTVRSTWVLLHSSRPCIPLLTTGYSSAAEPCSLVLWVFIFAKHQNNSTAQQQQPPFLWWPRDTQAKGGGAPSARGCCVFCPTPPVDLVSTSWRHGIVRVSVGPVRGEVQ
jgi:hypothetical protein